MNLDAYLNSPLFRALFDASREAVLITEAATKRILTANPQAVTLLSHPGSDLPGMRLNDLCPSQQQEILVSFIDETRRIGKPRNLTSRLQSQAGDPLPCEISVSPLRIEGAELLLVSFQDISERIRAMEDLELRDVAIANVTSGVTIADARQPDLPLIYVNQGFQNITGYSAREAVGRSCRFLQGEDRDQPALDELREALKKGEPCVVRLRNYKKDGSLFHNELHISPVRSENGELTHFVGIQLDVTEQVRARESLERSEARYRQALEREQELNEIKTRFISMVSHEFRTPMTGIQASAALVRKFGDTLGEEKKARHLGNIELSLKRMNRLLDDVLFFSRAEADKLKVERNPVDLNAYFRKLIEGLGHIYPGREVQFATRLPDDSEWLLDEHLLDHIFQNLIGNAIKYSPPETAVSCSATLENGHLVFRVADEGIGIPESDQAKLFEAFHRADNVGARQGTGLGLNIALRAVELLGGSLTFTSRENEGSTFLVNLPAINEPETTQ